MPDIRRPLKKFLPHLLKAKDDALNEADTVQRIIALLDEVLGYDRLTEVSMEAQIKERFCDVAIKLDGTIRWLIEVKAADTILRTRHLEQAERYAAQGNYPWVALTNGTSWHLYHLTFDEGIEYQPVFQIDLATAEVDHAAELLALLHRSAIIKGEHEEYLRHRQALDAKSLARALFSFDVLTKIRREIRRREGLLIDLDDLVAGFKELFTAEARERIGTVRVVRKKRRRTAIEASPAVPATPGAAPPAPDPPPISTPPPGTPS